MVQTTNYTKRLLAAVLLLLATAMPSLAQQPTLPTTDDGCYIINSNEDYETFRQIVATGNPFANAVLTNDITVSNSIGDLPEQFHYRGTFDGQGHFVTITGKTDRYATTGMFAYTAPGCVIRNVGLQGFLQPEEGKEGYFGALVNDATGTVIENCYSRVCVYGKDVSGQYLGGFVGVSHGKCFFENCAFTGELIEGPRLSGFVGHNEHNLSIKSCYSTTTTNFAMTYSSNANFFTDRMGDGDISMNNYYFPQDGVENKIDGCTDFGEQSVQNVARIAYQLNKTGKKGLVWYQFGDFPHPFKGRDGMIIVSKDNGSTVGAYYECSHSYSDHICSYCGDLEPGSKMEPVQKHEDNTCIDDVYYELQLEPGYGSNKYICVAYKVKTDAKAVHIPDTVNIKGTEYPVKALEASFGSSLEYIYIPKTVKYLRTSFENCSNLKYVHIADGTDPIVLQPFADCPIEKLYIGRDTEMNVGGLFSTNNESVARMTLFWGPRTTILGNARDHSMGTKFCSGLANCGVYLLGDGKSPNELKVLGNNDLSQNSGYFYVNRNVTGALSSDNRTGLFDFCVIAEYGPFVNTIAEKSFYSKEGQKELLVVNLSNAYNLETIGASAFDGCSRWGADLDFSTMKVKNFGERAFAGSHIRSVVLNPETQTIPSSLFAKSKLNKINIPASVTTIGAGAFSGCKGLCINIEESEAPLALKEDVLKESTVDAVYFGRNITGADDSSFSPSSVGVVTIGSKVTELKKAFFTRDSYDTFVLEESDKPLHFDDYFSGAAITYVLNRDMVCDKDGKYALPFTEKRKTFSVSFGDKFTTIYDNMFEGYLMLRHVLIPSSITEVGTKAFQNCEGMRVVSILGEPNIKDEAFAKCYALRYLYFMGESVQLGNNVFNECSKIEEVTTNFDKDPGAGSSDKAFNDATYSSAQLINIKNAEFTSDPWVKFSSVRPTKTNVSDNATSGEKFDRASVRHKFPVGELDMVYLPFDMDSYYFGVDAEIYRLDLTKDGDETAIYHHDAETPNETYRFTTDNISFVKVDIDNEKRLKRGNVYFIKVKHEEDKMAAYFNFFENNTLKVQNFKTFIPNDYETTSQFYAREWDISQDYTVDSRYYYYTYSDGVMKRINGQYHPEVCKPLLVGTIGKEKGFNLKNGEETITTSISDIAFSGDLEGYTSFYAADYNYIAPNWMDVYILTSADGTSVSMEAVEDRTINRGEAVLLKSNRVLNKISFGDNMDGGVKEQLTYALRGSSVSYAGNILKGVKEDTAVDEVSSAGFVYVLGNNAAGKDAGLYKLGSNGTIPAGTAYLDSSDLDEQLTARDCVLVCRDNSTGVKAVPAVDGKQRIYDLMGRRLREAGFKGIYIVNDKKVTVK